MKNRLLRWEIEKKKLTEFSGITFVVFPITHSRNTVIQRCALVTCWNTLIVAIVSRTNKHYIFCTDETSTINLIIFIWNEYCSWDYSDSVHLSSITHFCIQRIAFRMVHYYWSQLFLQDNSHTEHNSNLVLMFDNPLRRLAPI